MEWYVLRSLQRSNAKRFAYEALEEAGYDVFTPMRREVSGVGRGRRTRLVPFLTDLLFCRSTRTELDPLILRTPTLQYRFQRGLAYQQPMTVPSAAMDRFILATRLSNHTRFLHPSELTPDMAGRLVRVTAGPLKGLEGRFLALRGARRRRLLIELQGLVAAVVEVEREDIEVM